MNDHNHNTGDAPTGSSNANTSVDYDPLMMATDDTDNEPLLVLEEDYARTNNSLHRATSQLASAVMKRLGHGLASVTIVIMTIAVPLVSFHAIRDRRTDLAAFYSAGVIVLGTVVISTKLVYDHLTHWYMPDVQKYVVRILWMVPLYAVQSWLSLRFRDARLYIDTIRDFYEAYVIASFVYYLMELLGGTDQVVVLLRNKPANYGEHVFPLNLAIPSWTMGMEFMLQCKHGVLQYVVLKLFFAVLVAILEPIGWYGEGSFQWNYAYPYISFVLNVSVMYALYCLVKLFHATQHELRSPINWHPMGKFLCVKGVVFFTWWQGVLIFFLKDFGYITAENTSWDADDVANGLIDYLVCVEMLLFAMAHAYTFTHREYLPPQTPGEEVDSEEYRPPVIRTLDAPMDFRDALWSSTVPEETINDISRLRNGVNETVKQATNPGMICLASMEKAESI